MYKKRNVKKTYKKRAQKGKTFTKRVKNIVNRQIETKELVVQPSDGTLSLTADLFSQNITGMILKGDQGTMRDGNKIDIQKLQLSFRALKIDDEPSYIRIMATKENLPSLANNTSGSYTTNIISPSATSGSFFKNPRQGGTMEPLAPSNMFDKIAVDRGHSFIFDKTIKIKSNNVTGVNETQNVIQTIPIKYKSFRYSEDYPSEPTKTNKAIFIHMTTDKNISLEKLRTLIKWKDA